MVSFSCLAAKKSRIIFGVQKAPLILVSTKQNGRLKGSLKATAIKPVIDLILYT